MNILAEILGLAAESVEMGEFAQAAVCINNAWAILLTQDSETKTRYTERLESIHKALIHELDVIAP